MAHLFSAATWHCHLSSAKAWTVRIMGSLRFTGHPHTLHPHEKITTGTWHPQLSTAITHWLQRGYYTHFTDPERMVTCVKLKSAASRSRTRAADVRGEFVTTRPPALTVEKLLSNLWAYDVQMNTVNDQIFTLLKCRYILPRCVSIIFIFITKL